MLKYIPPTLIFKKSPVHITQCIWVFGVKIHGNKSSNDGDALCSLCSAKLCLNSYFQLGKFKKFRPESS